MTRTTEELLHELSGDLAPVRRVLPLRFAMGAVLGLWVLAVYVEWRMGGLAPAWGPHGRWDDPMYSALFVALTVAACAGLVAGLADRIPGRARLARRAGWVAGGAVLAAMASAGGDWWLYGEGKMASLGMAGSCVLRSVVLAGLPALGGVLLLRNTWGPGVQRAGVWVPVFAALLGAVAVHASCVYGGGKHMMLGHALGQSLLAAVVALLWWGASRWRPDPATRN